MKSIRRDRNYLEDKHGMSIIVKTVARLTGGIILLYGINIVLHGHLSPGGGFAGGVIVALAFIHLVLAFGKDVALEKLTRSWASTIESLGALMFLSIALLGYLGGYFFNNYFVSKGQPFEMFSAGIIPLCNIAICLKVGAGLYAIFICLILLRMNGDKK